MSLSVDGFLKLLSSSGVLAADEIARFEAQIPARKRSSDANSLVRELIRLRKLTPFQADVLYRQSPIPLILGNYVLEALIGEGGMGVVYRAQHRRMKRTVAIKVLSSESMRTADVVKRFIREAEAAAKLSHPNIVAAYDADEIDGVPFLAMEYVEGIDLHDYVCKNGPMPLEKALDCLLQAARGLEHAHLQGLIHRDIKPANILIDAQGTVKILDMGLARFYDPNSSLSTAQAAALTQAGGVVGTIDFMSPEQALDSTVADSLSDVYSLGATFHFLMTGRPMYEATSLTARLVAHRESPLPSICESRSDVPPQIDAIFHRMVAKQKEDRFASMTDLISQLTNWQNAPLSGSSSGAFVAVPPNVMNVIFDDE